MAKKAKARSERSSLMNVGRRVDYAVRALSYLAGQPEGKIVIKDRIADIMFQMMLLRPEEFDVLATMNLNGDYLSDAIAAEVGGVGIGDPNLPADRLHGEVE